MGKIQIIENKILKLTNVLIREMMEEDFDNVSSVVEQMGNYIKSKGYQPIGPFIQYAVPGTNEKGEADLSIKFIRQSDNYINHVEKPYKMETILRVKNCMYARYIGPESKLKFAFDKLNLMAFEEDIELKGDSYVIYVEQKDDIVIADVFMERV